MPEPPPPTLNVSVSDPPLEKKEGHMVAVVGNGCGEENGGREVLKGPDLSGVDLNKVGYGWICVSCMLVLVWPHLAWFWFAGACKSQCRLLPLCSRER